jgi:hypothetical protein
MADILTTWISLNGDWTDTESWSNGLPNTADHVAIFRRGSGVAPSRNLSTTDTIKELQIGEGFEHPIGALGNPLVIELTRRVFHFGNRRLYWTASPSSSPMPDIFLVSPDGADLDSDDNTLFVTTLLGVYAGRVRLGPKFRVGLDVGGVQGGNGPGLIIRGSGIRGAVVESQAPTIDRVIVDGGRFRMTAGTAPARINIVRGSADVRGSLTLSEIVQSGGRVRWDAPPAATLRVLHLSGGFFDGRVGAPDITIQNGAVISPGRLLVSQQADISGLVDLRNLGIG